MTPERRAQNTTFVRLLQIMRDESAKMVEDFDGKFTGATMGVVADAIRAIAANQAAMATILIEVIEGLNA